ncbi:MAG: hypothetical protein ACLGI3_05745, partial [Actinomycetes bacterium]
MPEEGGRCYRLGGGRRRAGNERRDGGRRRGLDCGGAGQLAQHHGTVGGPGRGRGGRARQRAAGTPGEVLAVRTGTP